MNIENLRFNKNASQAYLNLELPVIKNNIITSIEYMYSTQQSENINLFENEFNLLNIKLSKEKSIKDAYDEMVKDIYDEMENVFSTRNDVSAAATASTYEAMLSRPTNYVGNLGLVDEAAVTAYATLKVAEADAYGVYRLNRIAQFHTERDAILNS